MKTLLAFLFSVSLPAGAHTQAMFAADGTKATFLLMSMTANDTDASRLYAAMAVPEEVIDGKRTKRFNFDSVNNQRSLTVVCVMSSYVATSGTCTVILHATPESKIDKDALLANLTVSQPDDLERILQNFVTPAGDQILQTEDGHLQFALTRSDGRVTSFQINYR